MLWLVSENPGERKIPVHIKGTGLPSTNSGIQLTYNPDALQGLGIGDRIMIDVYWQEKLIFRKNDELLKLIRTADVDVTTKVKGGKWVIINPVLITNSQYVHRIIEKRNDLF
jgi:hypothetical protein